MRQVQISEFVTVQVDDDFALIDDELNGSVTLDGTDLQSLFSIWVKEGGLEAAVSDPEQRNPQGLRSQSTD